MNENESMPIADLTEHIDKINATAKLAAEVVRLRGVCEEWGANYQSWVDATNQAETRAASLASRLDAARALAAEWRHVGGGDSGGSGFADGYNAAMRAQADVLIAVLENEPVEATA